MPRPSRYLFAIMLLLATPGTLLGRPARRGFNLFDTSGIVFLQGNRVSCTISGIGELCVSPTNSPVEGGGFWPAGTVDQYVFNQGLQVAGIIAGSDLPSFPWPGDTAGAFFMDTRGDQQNGEALIAPISSTDPRARLTWPLVARANDPALYAPPLLGRPFIADQDVFTRFWDGNPLVGGRQHPAGLLVDLRAMAWNNDGLRDVVFFVYHVINISARSSAPYQRLAAAGYDADAIAEVARIGGRFQDASEQKYSVQIPDTGYTIQDMYLGFAQDADIGQAGSNYSNANHVFAATFAYKNDFREPTWSFPPDIFGSPFAAAPGFVGEAFLRTPPDTTALRTPTILWMTSNITGGFPHTDPVGVQKLWRYLSLNLLPATDGTCSVANPKVRHFCVHIQTASDTRISASTGPTQLDPGQSALLVVAQVHAAPVDSVVRPFIGLNLPPGLPVAGDRLAQGLDTVRTIDRVAGWQSSSDVNGNGIIEANEVVALPRSLYGKIQVASALADAGFLQPSAPRVPPAFVVPDDGRATVVWQQSPDEQTGDPYFQVASNPASRLYDPSFRRYDVEGYRVWRGTSPTNMHVVAQYDYQGTQITDYAGQIFPDQAFVRTCVPELGVTTTCFAFPHSMPLTGPLYQFRLGDRNRLFNGDVVVFAADTAVTGGGSGREQLSDRLVPFVYVDSGLANGATYYYGVTAFDVNSLRSGPSTLESPLALHSVTPRVPSSQPIPGAATVSLIGRSGNPLPAGTLPIVGTSSGIFTGPMPPANGLSAGFLAFVPNLVDDGATILTVDSVVPGDWFNGTAPAVYWFTAQGNIPTQKFSVSILGASTTTFGNDVTSTATFPAARLKQSSAAPSGGDSTYALQGYATVAVNGSYRYTNQYRALFNGDPGTGTSAGPRWWSGTGNENVNDPNGINCFTVASGTCTLADLSRNAGAIPGFGIFNIAAYGTIGTTEPVRTLEGITSGVFRAADFKWYWGGNGAVDSVVDVVHDVRVPFSPKIRASWGILNDSSFSNVVNKDSLPDSSRVRLTWGDIACVAPGPRYLRLAGSRQSCGGVANFAAPDSGAFLMNHARLGPISFASSTFPNLLALSATAATGTGFIIYLDGHFFMFSTATLPVQGTVWNMRTYAGNVTGAVGAYQFHPATRPAAVPGLRMQISYTGSAPDTTVSTASQLAAVHTVPDPYYLGNSLETAGHQVLRFVNLPSQAIIRIYSAGGTLVQLLQHNDPSGGGEASWDVRGRNGHDVATGVYFYHVEAPDGATRVGRFVIINTR